MRIIIKERVARCEIVAVRVWPEPSMPTWMYRARHHILWEWGQCLGLEYASLFSNLNVTVSSASVPL